VETIEAQNVPVDGQSLSSLSEPPSCSTSTTNNSAPNEDVNSEKLALVPLEEKVVKHRQTSKQKHQEDADEKRRKNKEKAALKMATKEIHFQLRIGAPISQREVVNHINNCMGTNVSSKTISQMIREGRIRMSPLKKGPVGDFAKPVRENMETAFVTYLKLGQANSRNQSTLSELGRHVNAMVNASGQHEKSQNGLAKKLKSCTAHHFEVNT